MSALLSTGWASWCVLEGVGPRGSDRWVTDGGPWGCVVGSEEMVAQERGRVGKQTLGIIAQTGGGRLPRVW